MKQFAMVCVVIGVLLSAAPVNAALKWAPATGVNMKNTKNADAVDGVWVDIYHDQRTYFGSGTFYSNHSYNSPDYSDDWLFQSDGDTLEDDWGGGGSGTVTNEPVEYRLGAWQGAAGAWTVTTTTGPL